MPSLSRSTMRKLVRRELLTSRRRGPRKIVRGRALQSMSAVDRADRLIPIITDQPFEASTWTPGLKASSAP